MIGWKRLLLGDVKKTKQNSLTLSHPADLLCVSRSVEEEEEEKKKVERTVFSARDLTDDTVTLRAERPALLLSSTSWTGGTRILVKLRAAKTGQ